MSLYRESATASVDAAPFQSRRADMGSTVHAVEARMNCKYDDSTMSWGRDAMRNDEVERDELSERRMGNSQKSNSASQFVSSAAQGGSATTLELIKRRIAEADRAHAVLLEKGYGRPWMPLEEIAKLVPRKTAKQGNR